MRIPTEHLTRDAIRRRADNFSELYNPDKIIPVSIDLIVEKDLGIDVVPLIGLRESLDNDGFISSDFTTIHIDWNNFLIDI